MAGGLFTRGAVCLGAAVLLLLSGQAQAGQRQHKDANSPRTHGAIRIASVSDNLQDLVDTQGSLTIGDKVFSNFDFVATGLTSFDASQIRVKASFDGGVYYLTWGGNMSLVSGGAATADLLLNYRVTATAGLISMIDQEYTGSGQPFGGSFLAIDESVRDTGGNLVANSHLDGSDLSDPFKETGDNLDLNPPQRVVDVTKDIGMGVSNGGFVTISQVRQSFHQTQVPEASSTVLLALGLALVGLVTFRQRRKA